MLIGLVFATSVIHAADPAAQAVVKEKDLAKKTQMVDALIASSPTNVQYKVLKVSVLAKQGKLAEAKAALAEVPEGKGMLARAQVQALSDKPGAAVKLLTDGIAAKTNRTQNIVYANRLADIHLSGGKGKMKVEGGKVVPLNPVDGKTVWPEVIALCESCQITTNQIGTAKQLLEKLKRAEVAGAITETELARAAKGIFNGLPVTPNAAEVFSKCKLLFELHKKKGEAGGTNQTSGMMELPTGDLVARWDEALAAPVPLAGTAYFRVLQRDKSLDAQEKWASAASRLRLERKQ